MTPPLTGNDASIEEADVTEPDAPLSTPADMTPERPPEDGATPHDILPDQIGRLVP